MPIDHGIYFQATPPHDALKSLNDQEIIRGNQQQNQAAAFKLQQEQQTAEAQTLLGEAMSRGGDIEAVGREILANPKTAAFWPKMRTELLTGEEKARQIAKLRQEYDDMVAADMDELATKAEAYPDDARADWVMTSVVKRANAGLMDKEDAEAIVDRYLKNPTTATLNDIVRDMKNTSQAGLKAKADREKVLADTAHQQFVNQGMPDTNAKLAAEAAQQEMITAGMSPTGVTAVQQADDKRADQQLAINRGHLAVAQRAAAGGTGALSAGDQALVKAVLKNPSIYAGMTATVRDRITAALSEQGFDFSAGATGKPPTGAQNVTLGYFNRLREADANLRSVEAEIAAQSTLGKLQGDVLPTMLQTQSQQLYRQAQRQWTEARLRKESGAAIPQNEYDADNQTNFVVAGNDAKTIEQKQRSRAATLAGMAYQAGPALHGFYGDDADTMIRDYQAQMKGAPAAPPAPKTVVRDRNGKLVFQ